MRASASRARRRRAQAVGGVGRCARGMDSPRRARRFASELAVRVTERKERGFSSERRGAGSSESGCGDWSMEDKCDCRDEMWRAGSAVVRARFRSAVTVENVRVRRRGVSSRRKAISRSESGRLDSRSATEMHAPATSLALRPQRKLPAAMA